MPNNNIAKMRVGSREHVEFSRIPNDLSETVGVSGLGLYWAYKIVKLHDGEIKVDSKEGKGSTFTVTIPKERSHA